MKHFDIRTPDVPYLKVQCGDIAHLNNPVDWCDAYDQRIERVYQSMRLHLPKTCGRILDVGGGFSGIGARLVEHFGAGAELWVVDGVATPAEVVRHNQPFNNAELAQAFLERNGVARSCYVTPELVSFPDPFDLVISTQAWGFHIAPHVYLPSVSRALARPATVIVDVRNRHADWLADLRNAFGQCAPIDGAEKWTRWCFHVE